MNRAKEMYYYYIANLKKNGAKNIRFRYPFKRHKRYYVLASMLADKVGASYKGWVVAQFEGLKENYVFILPSHLCSERATDRYMRYIRARNLKVLTPKEREKQKSKYIKRLTSKFNLSKPEAEELLKRYKGK